MAAVPQALEDRLAEVLRRSKKNFGPDVGAAIDALLSKTNLSILAGTLFLWGGSHLFGVGEIVDVILLAVGAFTIGWSIADVAKDLYTFGDRTINAKTDSDLDQAAQAFSHAIVLAGITVVMAVLLRRSVKEIQVTRGRKRSGRHAPARARLTESRSGPRSGSYVELTGYQK